VPEDLVLPVTRATVEAFRRLGDRRRRAHARLKVVVDNMGAEKFGDLLLGILEERGVGGLEAIERAASPEPAIGRPYLNGQEVIPQHQPGLSIVRVMIPRSELKTAQSRAIARIAEELGGGVVMFTNRQNLELHDVPKENTAAVLEALHAAGFRTDGHEHLPDIVACVGTTMCRLAVSDSPDAYSRLYNALAHDEAYWKSIGTLRINITGCPNNCAQAWVSDIGLRGTRIHVPGSGSIEGYSIFVGGKLSEAGKIAEHLCDAATEEIVPAVRKLLDTYLECRDGNEEAFVDFCERIGVERFRKLIN
jgi:sulfite reductase beta subunit-like hemoprotein